MPEPQETVQQRRARLDRVFGDVLPDTPRDERGPGTTEPGSGDERLLRDVPPHHG